jgi:hypothetical protein
MGVILCNNRHIHHTQPGWMEEGDDEEWVKTSFFRFHLPVFSAGNFLRFHCERDAATGLVSAHHQQRSIPIALSNAVT